MRFGRSSAFCFYIFMSLCPLVGSTAAVALPPGIDCKTQSPHTGKNWDEMFSISEEWRSVSRYLSRYGHHQLARRYVECRRQLWEHGAKQGWPRAKLHLGFFLVYDYKPRTEANVKRACKLVREARKQNPSFAKLKICEGGR